jgi:hypothetical protein
VAKGIVQINVDSKEQEQFSNFLLREASRSTFDKEAGQWSIPYHYIQEVFWLGAEWGLYKSKGYTFNSPKEGYGHTIGTKGNALAPRQQDDLQHVMSKLDHLIGHLSDFSTAVGVREPYDRQLDCDAQKLYIDACDLLHSGQQLLKRFDATLEFPEKTCYHPSTAMMPDMPLRCCPECKDAGDFTGMIFPEGKSAQ